MKTYSIFNAKKIFNPFQYKPFFKLIGEEVDGVVVNRRRLYISDEVGLGKTIEAGIIISNLISNNVILSNDKIVVIAPKILVRKWRDELNERFSLIFDIADKHSVNDESRNRIICKESLFSSEEFLFKIKPKLIIIDEAHHYRNENTVKYKNMKNVLNNATSDGYIVMMSATPYNNSSRDIDNQLSLLFNGDIPIASNNYFTKSQKAIAFKKSYTRNHKVISVKLSDNEYKVYNDVKQWYLNNNMKDYSGFGLNAIEKIATSSLYMLTKYFKEAGSIELKNYIDEEAELETDETSSFESTTKFLNKKEKKFSIKNLEKTSFRGVNIDSKLNALKEEVLKEIKENKIIIFTYYIKVAEYLKSNLELEYDVRTLTGNTSEEDRISNYNWFKREDADRDKAQILICTDVCREGIDFQFCSHMINYDLPYNPVTVEQRIGRIDRVGQESEMINIYSMYIEGTYDEKLYCILYSKLNEINFYANSGIGNEPNILVNEFELLKSRLNKWIQEIKTNLEKLNLTDNKTEEEKYQGIRENIKYNLDILNECFSIVIGKGKRCLSDEILRIEKYISEIKMKCADNLDNESIAKQYEKCEEQMKLLMFNEKKESSIAECINNEIDDTVKILNQKLKPYDSIIYECYKQTYKITVSEVLKEYIYSKLKSNGNLKYEIRNWFENYSDYKKEIEEKGIRANTKLRIRNEVIIEYSIGDGNVLGELYLPLYGEFYKTMMGG